jgi:hypothetical protein
MAEYFCANCGADTPSQCLCGRRASEFEQDAERSQLRTKQRLDIIERSARDAEERERVLIEPLRKLIEQNTQLTENVEKAQSVRTFDTGATRHTDNGKLDYEGFLSPAVLQEFAKYMHHHRIQSDGSQRASDNWQKGIPQDAYMKSLVRHVMDLWLLHRGHTVIRPEDGSEVTVADALGGILFNTQGYWHEILKETHEGTSD